MPSAVDPDKTTVESGAPTQRDFVATTADAKPEAVDAQVLENIAAATRERLFGGESMVARIGRFVVVDKIGEGGMGTVYGAYDEQLDRKVALKVLCEDDLPTPEDRQRLEREAVALARLSHPNVVTVHEVGDHHGEMFVAMEHVRGQGLDAWLKTEPPWQEVLGAFVQAGQGLVAAHEAELIHRDFKPANAMRRDDGLVKVLDFGLARVVGEDSLTDMEASPVSGSHAALSSLTRQGTVMGTPAYMSPEQHRGEAFDAHTDQYSFCVALWQGLTGARPFKAKSMAELYELKCAGPPPWPNEASSVPRRISAAIARGLSPQPEERWPNMKALLSELAWDPSARRTRWVVGLVSVSMLGLGGAMANAWAPDGADKCSGARAKIETVWNDARRQAGQKAFAGVEGAHTEDAWALALKSLDAYADAWVQMHTEACKATVVRAEQSPRLMDLRMGCLQRASVQLDAIAEVLVDADATVVMRAQKVVAGLRPLESCGDLEALEADVEPPTPEDAESVTEARRHLARARALDLAGRYEKAQAAVDEGWKALEGADYPPADAELWHQQGTVLEPQGKYDEAEEAFEHALQISSRWGQREIMFFAARKLMYLVGGKREKYDEALRYWPLVHGLSDDDPVRLARARNVRALILEGAGKYEEAEAESRAVLEVLTEELGPGHRDVAGGRFSLGLILKVQRRYEDAEVELRAAAEGMTQALGPEHPQVGAARHELAGVLESQGRPDEAAAVYQEVLASWERTLGPNHPNNASVLNNLGIIWKKQGKFDEAEAAYRRAMKMFQEAFGPDHPNIAMAMVNIGSMLEDQGKYAEAEAEYRRAKEILEGVHGAEHPLSAAAAYSLGSALERQGHYEEAEAEHRAALTVRTKRDPADDLEVSASQSGLALVLFRQGQHDEALRLAELGWERQRLDDVPLSEKARAAFILARVLGGVPAPAQDKARARTVAEQSLRLYRKAGAVHAHDAGLVEQWLREPPATRANSQ